MLLGMLFTLSCRVLGAFVCVFEYLQARHWFSSFPNPFSFITSPILAHLLTGLLTYRKLRSTEILTHLMSQLVKDRDKTSKPKPLHSIPPTAMTAEAGLSHQMGHSPGITLQPCCGLSTGGSSREHLFLAWAASSLWECLVRWDSGSFVPSVEFPPIVPLRKGTDCAVEWLKKDAKVGTGDNPSWRPLNHEEILGCLSCSSIQLGDSVVEILWQDTWKALVLFTKDSFTG